jgi:predicted MFS family arabinose efflux permease
MGNIPVEERSTASAVQNIVGALSQATAAVISGAIIVNYGYPRMLAGNGVIAIAAAMLFFFLLASSVRRTPNSRLAEEGSRGQS